MRKESYKQWCDLISLVWNKSESTSTSMNVSYHITYHIIIISYHFCFYSTIRHILNYLCLMFLHFSDTLLQWHDQSSAEIRWWSPRSSWCLDDKIDINIHWDDLPPYHCQQIDIIYTIYCILVTKSQINVSKTFENRTYISDFKEMIEIILELKVKMFAC